MRTSLTIAGIEVELSLMGRLESIVSRAYAPFLGAVVDPVFRVRLVAGEGVPLDLAPDLDADQAGQIVATVAPRPTEVDSVLLAVFSSLAPRHHALVVRGSGVISRGCAQVFVGSPESGSSKLVARAGHRPLLSDGYVLLRQEETGWTAAGAPFGGCDPRAPRQARLVGLWSPRPWPVMEIGRLDGPTAHGRLLEQVQLPEDDSSRQAALDLAEHLTSVVPMIEIAFDEGDGVWNEIEAVAVR